MRPRATGAQKAVSMSYTAGKWHVFIGRRQLDLHVLLHYLAKVRGLSEWYTSRAQE